MVVVSLTNCPPKLRGDLSKWLLEINTGVYVGQVSARVREALWKRICENVGSGQAAMVREAIRDKDAVIAEIPAQTEIMMAGLKGEPLDCDSPGVRDIIDKVCEFK